MHNMKVNAKNLNPQPALYSSLAKIFISLIVVMLIFSFRQNRANISCTRCLCLRVTGIPPTALDWFLRSSSKSPFAGTSTLSLPCSEACSSPALKPASCAARKMSNIEVGLRRKSSHCRSDSLLGCIASFLPALREEILDLLDCFSVLSRLD